MSKKYFVLDIETDGLKKAKIIWIVCVKEVDKGETFCFKFDEKDEFIKWFDSVKEQAIFIGHNIDDFDIDKLEKIWGISGDIKTYDTLSESRKIFINYPEFDSNYFFDFGPHSLAHWGKRFGIEKGVDSDYKNWHEGKIKYCKNDVEITETLYNFLEHSRLPEIV